MKFLLAAFAAATLFAAAPATACDHCDGKKTAAAEEKPSCGCDHRASKQCKCEACKCADCPVHGKKVKEEGKKTT